MFQFRRMHYELLILLASYGLCSRQIPLPSSRHKIVLQLLEEFSEYTSILYHFDSGNNHDFNFDGIISKSYLLLNLRSLNTFKEYKNYTGSSKVHVISLSRGNFFKTVLRHSGIFNNKDSAVILDGLNLTTTANILDSLYFMKYVFVYNMNAGKLFQCRYYIGTKCIVEKISSKIIGGGFLKSLPQNLLQLGNQHFKICYKEYYSNFKLR